MQGIILDWFGLFVDMQCANSLPLSIEHSSFITLIHVVVNYWHCIANYNDTSLGHYAHSQHTSSNGEAFLPWPSAIVNAHSVNTWLHAMVYCLFSTMTLLLYACHCNVLHMTICQVHIMKHKQCGLFYIHPHSNSQIGNKCTCKTHNIFLQSLCEIDSY